MLTGDYRDVRQFIYSLETAPEFMVLENVALSAPEDQERGLTVKLDIATYFRAGNAAADQASAARPRPWLLIALGAAVVALVTYQLWPSAATGSGAV